MIVDGRAIAEDIYGELSARRARIKGPVRLGIVVSRSDPAIDAFVRIKAKAAARLSIDVVRIDALEGASTAEVKALVEKLVGDVDGIIVQLPLPGDVDTDAVLSAIPRDKDVDAINPAVSDSERVVYAPVASAVEEILKRAEIETAGKRAVVVGAGRLVGAPSAVILKRLGARVTTVTLSRGSIDELRDADIIVLGAGKPHFIKPEHIKAGVVVIDAGTSEQGGKVSGDADPACAEKASVFTPVPGGVGPIAVAMIFKNLLTLLGAYTIEA